MGFAHDPSSAGDHSSTLLRRIPLIPFLLSSSTSDPILNSLWLAGGFAGVLTESTFALLLAILADWLGPAFTAGFGGATAGLEGFGLTGGFGQGTDSRLSGGLGCSSPTASSAGSKRTGQKRATIPSVLWPCSNSERVQAENVLLPSCCTEA